MQEYFYEIGERLTGMLRGREVYTCSFSAEESDFVRFNHGRIRQAGAVIQRYLSLDLIEGRRHASAALTLSGELEEDEARLRAAVESLRAQRHELPEDPFLLYATEVQSSERRRENHLPDSAWAVCRARQAGGRGGDLVGVYAAGGVHAGFANSFGQRNWFTAYSFNLDWSNYVGGDRAVKSSHAGFEWNDQEFERKLDAAGEQLAALARPPRDIRPGRYRVFLAPAAMDELVGILCWGGFGLRAHRTKTTPLLRMVEEGAQLSEAVSFVENTEESVAPHFQEAGFIRPPRVPLISGGSYQACLVSPRSAVEFGASTNGASAGESPLSVDMAPGGLPLERVLGALQTGVYVGNLHYLNYSDRSACRTTGMTRFATFWVENGRIQAPLEVMRFDETVYRMLGTRLVDLTAERELILDPLTYGQRSTRSARLPGALIEDFTFTL